MGMRGTAPCSSAASLVVLVMRSVVIASRHILGVPICPDLLWASFASCGRRSEYSSARSECQFPDVVVAFFIVFGGGAMGFRGKFMLFGGLSMCRSYMLFSTVARMVHFRLHDADHSHSG